MAVPFKITDINHGLKEAEGLLKLVPKGIELEFKVQDVLLGIFKSDVKTVRISYADLTSITFKKGWFAAKIILEGISMKVFDGVPGTEVATCVLKVKRDERKEAEKLISNARLHHSEYKLGQMKDD